MDSIPLEWDHDYDLEPMGHTMSSKKKGRGMEDEAAVSSTTAALKGACVHSRVRVKTCDVITVAVLNKKLVCFVVCVSLHRRSDS